MINLNQNMMNTNQMNQNMNTINENNQIINNNSNTNEKFNNLVELLKNVIIKINEINSIIESRNNNNLVELINQVSSNITESQINNISTVILEKLEFIKNHLVANKNMLKALKETNVEINLKYCAKESGFNNIFGKKFVVNNKNNIDLIINGNFHNLIDEFELKKGENTVQMLIKNPLIN
jgi:hypothetical protein